MTTNVPLSVTELDFDSIKTSLKEFLRAKDSPIKDYDYEGSNFSIILDALAANTHYNSLYMNFVANEMFLDSALLRSSIVSIAKELGYVPRSARASKATIRVSVGPYIAGNTVITVPAQTKFVSNVDGIVFNYFNVDEEFLEWSATDNAYVGEFDVLCGDLYTQTTTITGSTNRILLEADDIDTSTLLVQVQHSALDSTTQTFGNFSKVLELNSESLVYFLSETDLMRYELRFGDGILGKAVSNGNIVSVKYIAANLEAPYNAKDFLPQDDFYPDFVVSVTAVVPSSKAIPIETPDSIKQNIQRYNQSQDRSVISSDYEYHILSAFPEVRSCIVWGGEENSPPQYGKIFASCIIDNLTAIPQSKKIKISEELKTRSTINIRPEIIDPEYVDIILTGFIRYGIQELGFSSAELKNLIMSAITNYSSTNLEKFNSSFAYSQLATAINSIDSAIKSIVLNFKLSAKVRIDSSTLFFATKNFRNPIRSGTLVSTRYYQDGDVTKPYQIEDVNGVLVEYNFPDNQETNKQFSRNVGSIDYAVGTVTLSGLKGEPVDGSSDLIFTFDVDSTEIASDFNQVLKIDTKTSAVRIEVRGQ